MIRLIRPIIKKNLPYPKLGAQPRACLLRAFAPSREPNILPTTGDASPAARLAAQRQDTTPEMG